jgi:hypothetical protein
VNRSASPLISIVVTVLDEAQLIGSFLIQLRASAPAAEMTPSQAALALPIMSCVLGAGERGVNNATGNALVEVYSLP